MSVRRNLRLAVKSDHTWMDQPAATSSPIPDHVLLCCFGPELAGARHRDSSPPRCSKPDTGCTGAAPHPRQSTSHSRDRPPLPPQALRRDSFLTAPLEPAPPPPKACHGERARRNAVRAPDDGVMRGSVLALAAGLLIAGCSSSTGLSAPRPLPRPPPRARRRLHLGRNNSDVALDGRASHDGRAGNVRGRHGQRSDRARQVLRARPVRGSTCYYARLRNNDGDAGDIIAEELSHGQIIMTVRASDGYVTVSGCTFIAAS